MSTELVAYRFSANPVADEKNTAAYWAFCYVGWMTFLERHPNTDPVKYPNTSPEAIAKLAALCFRDYQRSLEWAELHARRGA
jgi:hypothetical protein